MFKCAMPANSMAVVTISGGSPENDGPHWTLVSTEVDYSPTGYILVCPLEDL